VAFEVEIVIRMGGDALLGLGLCLAFCPLFALGLMLLTLVCFAIPKGGLFLVGNMFLNAVI
jgi:hypothetical protein